MLVSEVENFKLLRFETSVDALNLATYFKDLHGYLSSGMNLVKFLLLRLNSSLFSSSDFIGCL